MLPSFTLCPRVRRLQRTKLHFMSLYAKFAENLVKSGSMNHGWNKQLMMETCSRIVWCTEKSFLWRCWLEHCSTAQLSNAPVPERDGERDGGRCWRENGGGHGERHAGETEGDMEEDTEGDTEEYTEGDTEEGDTEEGRDAGWEWDRGDGSGHGREGTGWMEGGVRMETTRWRRWDGGDEMEKMG